MLNCIRTCRKGTDCKQRIKMNQIVNRLLLADDKFMPEMHLKQPGLTYNACGPFTKNKVRIQKFKETGDTSYIYKNELDKACFHHDMACGDFKYLKKRTLSDKILKDKAYNFAKNPKCDGYQRLFDKKSASGDVPNNDIKQNFQLAKELHKPIIRKFKKRKSLFRI